MGILLSYASGDGEAGKAGVPPMADSGSASGGAGESGGSGRIPSKGGKIGAFLKNGSR